MISGVGVAESSIVFVAEAIRSCVSVAAEIVPVEIAMVPDAGMATTFSAGTITIFFSCFCFDVAVFCGFVFVSFGFFAPVPFATTGFIVGVADGEAVVAAVREAVAACDTATAVGVALTADVAKRGDTVAVAVVSEIVAVAVSGMIVFFAIVADLPFDLPFVVALGFETVFSAFEVVFGLSATAVVADATGVEA